MSIELIKQRYGSSNHYFLHNSETNKNSNALVYFDKQSNLFKFVSPNHHRVIYPKYEVINMGSECDLFCTKQNIRFELDYRAFCFYHNNVNIGHYWFTNNKFEIWQSNYVNELATLFCRIASFMKED